jgi:hypothetical protein
MSASEFSTDRDGFFALSELDEPALMFFSVPYDKGWSATVNGREVVIEKANIGFMAVRVPAGRAEIRFIYRPYGFREGVWISAAALGLFLLYMLLAVQASRRARARALAQSEADAKARREFEARLEALEAPAESGTEPPPEADSEERDE